MSFDVTIIFFMYVKHYISYKTGTLYFCYPWKLTNLQLIYYLAGHHLSRYAVVTGTDLFFFFLVFYCLQHVHDMFSLNSWIHIVIFHANSFNCTLFLFSVTHSTELNKFYQQNLSVRRTVHSFGCLLLYEQPMRPTPCLHVPPFPSLSFSSLISLSRAVASTCWHRCFYTRVQ